jgi:hypothetical protein
MELKYSNGRFVFRQSTSASDNGDAKAMLKRHIREVLCEKALERIVKKRMPQFDSYDRLEWDELSVFIIQYLAVKQMSKSRNSISMAGQPNTDIDRK